MSAIFAFLVKLGLAALGFHFTVMLGSTVIGAVWGIGGLVWSGIKKMASTRVGAVLLLAILLPLGALGLSYRVFEFSHSITALCILYDPSLAVEWAANQGEAQ